MINSFKENAKTETIITIQDTKLENILGYNLDVKNLSKCVSKSKAGTIINFDKVRRNNTEKELIEALKETKVDETYEDFSLYVLECCVLNNTTKLIIKG